MKKNKISVFVTGASGFVGSKVVECLEELSDFGIYALLRSPFNFHKSVTTVFIKKTNILFSLMPLDGIDVIVHAAARVHIMNNHTADSLKEFRLVNTEGTLNLARQAAAAGVKRFVFISSIKVNGEGTPLGQPYTAEDVPDPSDPYGISKMEAERGLRVLARETGMEVVIIRPVLVYGPGVKANFRSMMNWLNKGMPLPLGAIHNQRSLVALDNLVDLIVTCIDHPLAANQTFLVSDGEDLSTTELLQRMGQALDKPVRLLPIPPSLLTIGAGLLGRKDVAKRLCGSLQVDISKARSVLGWKPPVSVDAALRKTAQHFLAK